MYKVILYLKNIVQYNEKEFIVTMLFSVIYLPLVSHYAYFIVIASIVFSAKIRIILDNIILLLLQNYTEPTALGRIYRILWLYA